jgi:hypothetical protein
MRVINKLAASVALATILAVGSAQANVLTNGSFELGTPSPDGNGSTNVLSGDSTTITGWTVLGPTDPRGLSWDVTSSFGLFAQQGNYFLDLTGYRDGNGYFGVKQTIATTPGTQYLLSFYLGSDPRYGLQDGITATASAGPTSATFTSTNNGSTLSLWQLETMLFTATGTSTDITLLGASANPSYIGLDNVSVNPTPLPSTWLMLLSGFVGLGFFAYRGTTRRTAIAA